MFETCSTAVVALLDLKQESAIPGVTIGTLLMVVVLLQVLRKEESPGRSSNSSPEPPPRTSYSTSSLLKGAHQSNTVAPGERSYSKSAALHHRDFLREKIEVGDCFYVIKEANSFIAYRVGNREQRFTQIIPTKVRAAAFATNQNISLRKISKNGAHLWELVPKPGATQKSV